MAKEAKKETYASKHDFHCISISDLKNQVKLAYRARRPLSIVGPSGIGKSAIIRQASSEIGEELGVENFECRTIITSQKVPEDFTGIPIPDMAAEVVKFFKLEELPQDPNSYGILFLDEINQADMTVLRALFQLLGERRIGTYTLPKNWQMVAAMNPDGENYGTTKPSPALRRRLAWIEVKFNGPAFLDHAEEAGFHETVVEFLRRNPNKMLNETALANDKVFACPASWEAFSDVVYALRDDEPASLLLPIGAGLVGFTYTKDFIRFFNEHKTQIDPKEVFENYHKGNLRSKVLRYVKNGRTDVLTSICNALVTYMIGSSISDKKFEQRAQNYTQFFIDLPNDTATFLLNTISKNFRDKGMLEERKIWNVKVSKHPEGSQKYRELLRMTTLIDKEKAAAGVS